MGTYEEEKKRFDEASESFRDAAFPAIFEMQYQSKPNLKYASFSKGLSKREYFAAMAMIAQRVVNPATASCDTAFAALEDADALIEQLNKTQV